MAATPIRRTPAQRRRHGTRERVLDVAERLVQQRGFNGFSYADVAGELGITKASLHYHFPGKAELGEALIARYSDRFGEALAAIDAKTDDSHRKLDAYLDLYAEVLRGGRMCLCGMLAAEHEALSKPMRDAVDAFFGLNDAWLEQTLQQGRRQGRLGFPGSARDAARMITSALQGAMLIARPHADLTRFQTTAKDLIASIARPGHGAFMEPSGRNRSQTVANQAPSNPAKPSGSATPRNRRQRSEI